jgi:hypothetical protein
MPSFLVSAFIHPGWTFPRVGKPPVSVRPLIAIAVPVTPACTQSVSPAAQKHNIARALTAPNDDSYLSTCRRRAPSSLRFGAGQNLKRFGAGQNLKQLHPRRRNTGGRCPNGHVFSSTADMNRR